MIRKAFHSVQKKQRRTYHGILAVVTLAALCAGGYAYYPHRRLMQQQTLAQDLFYTMKDLDVKIANLELRIASGSNAQSQDDLRRDYLGKQRRRSDLRAVPLGPR